MSDSSNNLDRKNNARPSLFERCSNFQQSWAQGEWHEPLFIRRAEWEIENQLGDWNKTRFKFKWGEGGVTETRVGGLREEEEETEILCLLHISPEIHRTTQISQWQWLAAEFPLTLFRVFVFLNQTHAPAYCGIFVLCVIRLRWHYVAPSLDVLTLNITS